MKSSEAIEDGCKYCGVRNIRSEILSPEIFGWWRTHSFKNVGRGFMRSVAWSPWSGFLKF
jgi:hypothetical protein